MNTQYINTISNPEKPEHLHIFPEWLSGLQRSPCKRDIVGSNPTSGSNFRILTCSLMDRTLGYEPRDGSSSLLRSTINNTDLWCNWQHDRFWFCNSEFESRWVCKYIGLIAQRLGPRTHNPLVVGSNPTRPT